MESKRHRTMRSLLSPCRALAPVLLALFAGALVACDGDDDASATPGANPDAGDAGLPPFDSASSDADSAAEGGPSEGGPVQGGSNRSPTVVGETFVTRLDTAVSLPALLANDSDPEGHPLSIASHSSPAHGTLTPSGDDSFEYVPSKGFAGQDQFDYTVVDGRGGSATATVFVLVARRAFYVSAAGNDANDGLTPDKAWQTLGKVQSAVYTSTFVPGDAILLRRGDTFRGTLSMSRSGTAEEPVVIADYGASPAKPRVLGSQLVTGWKDRGDGSYSAPFPSDPKRLYADGALQTLARFPNTGWLRNDGGGATYLTDTDLPGPAGRWDGANVRIRSVNWGYEVVRAQSHTTGRLDFDASLSNSIHDGDWGYFLDGVPEALDAAGEWVYSEGQILWIPPAGAKPDDLIVEAPVEAKGLELTGDHQVLANVEVAYQRDVGLDFNYLKHHVTVRHAHVHDNYNAVRAYDDDILLYECVFERSDGTGIKMSGARNQLVRSVVRNIAMRPGFGENAWGYIGVDMGGTDPVVRENLIEDIGYIGLGGAGERTILERNVIRRALAILNDGAGLSFDHTGGLVVRDNIVLDTVGSLESASATQMVNYRIAFGIYFGNTDIHDATIERNIAAYQGSGIHVDHTTRSRGNVVRDNITFENETAINFSDFSNDQNPPPAGMCMPMYDDGLTGNTFIASRPGDRLLHIFEVHCLQDVVWWGGGFDKNRYIHPYSDIIATRLDFHSASHNGETVNDTFTFAEWRAHTGQEENSSTWGLPDAAPQFVLLYNEDRGPRVIELGEPHRALDGSPVVGAVTLEPYQGRVLVRGAAPP